MIYPKLEPIGDLELNNGDIVWLRGVVDKYDDGSAKIGIPTEHMGYPMHPWTMPAKHIVCHVEDATATHPLETENARLRGVIRRVLDGNYPRAGLHATGTAGVQECQHLVTVGPFSHCHSCMRNFLAEAMADQWGEAA